MVLNDKVVCGILGNKSVKAYKYGTLKPKIDKIMELLSNEIDKKHEIIIKDIKSDIIEYVKKK